MARIRTIKPEFWTSEQIVECSTNARLLFIGLWNFCDDAGRHPDSPKRIKMEVFPGDDIDVRPLLDQLEGVGLIARYEVDGEWFIEVKSWKKHQKIDQPTYRYPGPDGNIEQSNSRRRQGEQSASVRRTLGERSPPEGNGREGKGMDRGGASRQTGEYVFDGVIVKLTADQYARWEKSFPLARLDVELPKADAYYADNPPKGGKWFFPVSRWLAKAHDERRREINRELDSDPFTRAGRKALKVAAK